MYPIQYVPDADMPRAVKDTKAQLVGIRGKFRWLATDAEGRKFIIRPESANPDHVQQS